MNKHHLNIRFVTNMLIGFAVVLIIVLLPTSADRTLINGIQTAKSFNFFYSMLALLAVAGIGLLFNKVKIKPNITLIDVLLVAFVVWLTVNKYLLQGVHSFSLRYFELLGLMAFYIIVRTLKTKYALYLLLAICISGAVQAVYGNLQLWGRYPSHHGLFKMTGSFFNPGPYAGYLCAVLPVAVGLHWMHKNCKFSYADFASSIKGTSFRFQVSGSKFQVPSLTTLRSVDLRFRLRLNLLNRQLGTWNLKLLIAKLKPIIIKYISLVTIVSVLLVLPAARSRAAWLGAIAGVAYLAWHKYSVGIRLIAYLKGRTKPPFVAKRSPEYREGKQRSALANLEANLWVNVRVKVRKLVLVLLPVLFLVAGTLGLYHYKKDSADGRMLIWKVTANIIKDKPLLGVGHDRFKTHYMDYQAGYLRNNPGSKYETVADDNQYAFNEPLNAWAENGLIGILLLGGIVLAVFNSKFQVSSSEQDDSKFQVSGSKLSSEQPESERSGDEALRSSEKRNRRSQTWNLKLETGRSVIKPVTITRAAILSILVFGLFAYPSEILPTKIIATVCLAMLASTTTSLLKSNEYSLVPFVKNPLCPSWLKPLWLKSSLALATLAVMVLLLPPIKRLHGDYATWKNALDLYNFGLYEQCLTEYEKAYPLLKHNGEFLINYGKALSIAEKHPEAVTILEQAKSHQSNSVMYTALGDSHKALEEYQSAEQNYLQSANMAPVKFYPLYLLAKLYDANGQQHKAIAMANTILNKDIKVNSTAIDEIKKEMKTIIAK